MTGPKPPPHDDVAEGAVLGALLHYGPSAAAALNGLDVGHFYRPSHGFVFQAIANRISAGNPIDAALIADDLHQAAQLDVAGGRATLVDLAAGAPVLAVASEHAARLVELHRRRQLHAAGLKVVDAAETGADARALAELVAAAAHPAVDGGLLAGLRNGGWLDRQQFPPLRYHLPSIVPEGLTFLIGPPKIGKSWFVLGLGQAAASGGRMLGLPIERRPVLYLALEDGDRRLQDRCRRMLGLDEAIPEALEYLCRVRPDNVLDTITAWMRRHRGAEPLVILDTLGKVMPPAVAGETTYSRDYRIGSDLKRLADDEPGAALLVNHHDRKAGSDDFVERVSGTNGLAGAADTILVLSRDRHSTDGTINVTGRDIAENEYAVTFDPQRGAWSLRGSDLRESAAIAAQQRATVGQTDNSREVLAYVAEHPEGVRFADVKRDLGDTAARYLSRLADGGALAKAARGLYIPLSELSDCPLPDNGQPDTTDSTFGGEMF